MPRTAPSIVMNSPSSMADTRDGEATRPTATAKIAIPRGATFEIFLTLEVIDDQYPSTGNRCDALASGLAGAYVQMRRALGLRPAMREKGYGVRVGVGTASMFIVVALIALDLGQQTIARFQEARDEEWVIIAANEWIGPHPVEIQRVDVARDNVDISLIFDVPLHFAQEQKAPSEMLSGEFDERILAQKIREILGRNVKINYRGQLRYTGVVAPPLAR